MSHEASLGADDVLLHGELTVLGRIMPASNHTFLCQLGSGEDVVKAVYKPVSGERPLWDFTDGTLANREYAAWLVSEATGWNVVPPTTLREGPAGSGMVQLWQEPDETQDPVDLVPQGQEPPGYLSVLDAYDVQDRPVSLVHEDSTALRRMAIFDLVVNNTDRKGGHVLAMPDGHRYGVDHGVCFHTDDKLRTVLWGWAGQALTEDETAVLERLKLRLLDSPTGDVAELLKPLLTGRELAALRRRLRRLLLAGRFPVPSGEWPAIPWPPF